MKRWIALFMTVLMLVALVGCGDNEDKPGESDATTTAPSQTDTTAEVPETTTGAQTTVATTQTAVNTTKKPASKPTTTTSWYEVVTTPSTTWDGKLEKLPAAVGLNVKKIGGTVVSPITNDTYKLVFFDDFTGTALNAKNWKFEKRNAGGAEIQANVEKNLEIANSLARIHAKKETTKYPMYVDGSSTSKKDSYYTAAKFTSSGLQAFKYGRFEMYCRLPFGKGMWPAFWTMGQYDGWPFGGEIDILEMAGLDYSYVSTIHWCRPNETDPYGSGHKSASGGQLALPSLQNDKLANEFHVIGMEWTERKIYFYCDGEQFGSVSIAGTDKKTAFHQEHYMLINLALGGMGGTIDDSKLPQVMEVDWVKVWQK